MRHRIAIAAMVAATLIVGACEDREGGASRLATEPGIGNSASVSGALHYTVTNSVAIRSGPTHELRPVQLPSSSIGGVSAAVVAASGSSGPLQLENGLPGYGTTGGSIVTAFDDSSNHHHKLVLLYAKIGGPPVAMQHFVDGGLISTSAYRWQKLAGGYVRTQSLLQVVGKGTLTGTFTTTTTVITPPPGKGGGPPQTVRLEHSAPGPFQRAVGSVALHLALAFAPEEARAQSIAFTACRQEWLKYAAAAAVVAGLSVVVADLPVLTPLLASQFVGSLALLAAAEDLLLSCILMHQPGPGSVFGGSGGGSGGGSTPPADCLAGSYAAHCTTPFTL